MNVERKQNNANHRRTAVEIFLPANGRTKIPAVKRFHARLSSPAFANRMRGIFFDAKRAALLNAK